MSFGFDASASVSASAGASFSASASLSLGAGFRKAVIRRVDGEGEVEVHFNPSQITVKREAVWIEQTVPQASRGTGSHYGGAKARTIDLTLTLDGPSTGRDVTEDAQLLQDWCNPTQASVDEGKPKAPLVRFDWTPATSFDAYLFQVIATYKLFDRDGSAMRATVACNLKESPESADRQNPTSGGLPGRRTHVVQSGESLQSLAYRFYGDAGKWRALASFNRVGNPMALRPGARLELPPARTLAP
jgi:hypothetical protein